MSTKNNQNVSNLIKQFKPSDLIVIAGNSGVGKTSLALDILMKEAIQNQKPIAIFPLEMRKKEVTERILSCVSGIELSKISKQQLTSDEINVLWKKSIELDNYPMYIDDSSELSIADIKNKCLQLKELHSVETVIIDALQCVKSSSNNISLSVIYNKLSDLKELAKELNIKIITVYNTIRNQRHTLSNDCINFLIYLSRPELNYSILYKLNENGFDTKSLLVLEVSKKTEENDLFLIGEVLLLRIEDKTMVLNDAIPIEKQKQSTDQPNPFKLPKVDKEKIERFNKLSDQQNKEFNRMVLKRFFTIIVNLFAIIGFVGLILQLTGVIKFK
jgi:GTPase SAR1 family protein